MSKQSLKAMTLVSLALIAVVLAPQRALADDDDPPSRVARLGYAHGSISFQPAGTDDWVSAVVNRPLTTGDKLWADADSRAELHIGSASIRMSSMTGFSFLNLTDGVTQIQLTSGTLRVRVKRLDENETFEIDTPNLAFSVLRPGVYRISVNESGDTTIIRGRRGEGEITGGGSAFHLAPGEVGTFNGTDQLTADIERFGDDDDDFDRWCDDRDRHEDLSVSARYVSPDVIGYQDLDEYGGWRPVPGYGQVWFPQTTIVGWAPYHYGHWAYVSPWGYTWIDDAPWGFAPFHYGRWINYGGVWGWVPCPPPAPGVVYVRPVYAPALVAWVGGPHFGVAVSAGGGFAAGVNVGWFPLGPREVYVPSYPVSRTYVNNVNVSNTTVNTTVVNNYYNTTVVNRTTVVNNNVTVIHQTYVNQTVAGAVTATTPQAFTSAQPVSRNVVRVDVREVAAAPVNAFTPAVPPARQAVLGAGVAARVRPPAVVETRAVVAKTPPPPPPVPFARQQQAIQANGGRPLAVSQVRQIQPQTVQAGHPMVKIAPPSTPSVPRNVQANRPGQPQNTSGNTAGVPGNTGNKNGNPNSPGATHTGPQPPVFNNQPGAPTNNSQPVANTNRPNTPTNNGRPGNENTSGGGNANPDRRTFNDRPPSASGGNNPGSGNGPAGGNAGSDKNAGNANPDRRTFNDRPPSASGGNNPGSGNGPVGGNAGSDKNAGNTNPDHRTFNDRAPGASSGNNPGSSNGPAGGNAGSDKNTGNTNPDRRSFNDRAPGASGGNNSGSGNGPAGGNGGSNKNVGNTNPDHGTFNARPASASGGNNPGPGNGPAAGNAGSSNQRHEPPPQNAEQKHDNKVQKPQQKQQQEEKDKSSKSKDDQHH